MTDSRAMRCLCINAPSLTNIHVQTAKKELTKILFTFALFYYSQVLFVRRFRFLLCFECLSLPFTTAQYLLQLNRSHWPVLPPCRHAGFKESFLCVFLFNSSQLQWFALLLRNAIIFTLNFLCLHNFVSFLFSCTHPHTKVSPSLSFSPIVDGNINNILHDASDHFAQRDENNTNTHNQTHTHTHTQTHIQTGDGHTHYKTNLEGARILTGMMMMMMKEHKEKIENPYSYGAVAHIPTNTRGNGSSTSTAMESSS